MSDACKLFVGSLSYDARNEDLMDRFEEIGKVSDAIIITDRETGRSRGFGFVTFTNEKDAEDAKNQLNESEFMGRTITVRQAQSRRGGGGGGGYGGGGGRRYNDGGYGGGYRSSEFYCFIVILLNSHFTGINLLMICPEHNTKALCSFKLSLRFGKFVFSCYSL